MQITETSKQLFIGLAEDAANWSGEPPFWGTKEERGNLTQLKRAKLLKTFTDEGDTFVCFTRLGAEYAAECGIDLSWIEQWPGFHAG